MSTMLEIDVARRQGDFSLDVAFTAGSGVTALFGRSGSGKTSLINMVAGLSRPDRGRIVVDGKVLFDSQSGLDLPPEARRLGYVFQEHRLFPHLSVRDNLWFGTKRLPVAERRVSLDHVVSVLGIGHLLDRRPTGLSGGEKQRVAIGRALLASPRILLMDEPLASLDAARKSELLPFIAGLSRQFDIPIVYVSHSMEEVLRLADTLALIDAGRLVAIGPVEDLLSSPAYAPLTGHGEAGSVLAATLSADEAEFSISTLSFPGGTLKVGRIASPPGSPVRVRIHAHDVAIALFPPVGLSVRNQLPAIVRSVTPIDSYLTDVMLDCGGCPLWSRITTEAQSELSLKPGMAVTALIKSLTIARGDVADRSDILPG
ncbi:ABC-type molybdate transport system, ATPase component [Magnetospirillum fulvum MGU-K5]|uniref:ABC-type molybdate transport system, ATPase component n=2 Tax=Magnetospirillum fulvum TaxID=1082 RepID=S9S707_MAGFU|nr:ABC-type molybdate transport system, ATPase component [Magnetospirillum fulvum MGU-K5]